jgi:hypothetical protein
MKRSLLIDVVDALVVHRFGKSAGCFIPRNIEALGKSIFSNATLDRLTFAARSKLVAIGEGCFSSASLRLVCVLRSVEVLSKAAFWRADVDRLSLEAESGLKWIEESCFAHAKMSFLGITRSVGDCASITRRSSC